MTRTSQLPEVPVAEIEDDATALWSLMHAVSLNPLVRAKSVRRSSALPYTWIPRASRFALVLGDNASGKSVLRRLVRDVAVERKLTVLSASMEARGYISAVHEYGLEGSESTGMISARRVRKLLQQSSRAAGPHVLLLDEPDLGMSDGLAAGVGMLLAEHYADGKVPRCVGVLVTTHNRAMVREVLRHVDPNVVWFGPNPETFDVHEWLARVEPPRSIDDVIQGATRTSNRVGAILRREQRKAKRTGADT